MTVLQQAHLYVDQLRREANKTRINVSEAIQDMKVHFLAAKASLYVVIYVSQSVRLANQNQA